MASPPFTPAISLPGDSDIVSQFPAGERTLRDIMNSWMLIDHDNNGKHIQVSLTNQAVDPTMAATILGVFQALDTSLKQRLAGGTSEYVGVPPASVFFTAANNGAGVPVIPPGYLQCDGSSQPTATYPRLFAAIGYFFGGVGANFTLPDIAQRVIVGKGVGSRTTTFLTATTLGAVGGDQNLYAHTHSISDPTHTHSISDPGHSHAGQAATPTSGPSGANIPQLKLATTVDTSFNTGNATTGVTIIAASTGITGTVSAGTGVGGNIQPSIVLTPIIRF